VNASPVAAVGLILRQIAPLLRRVDRSQLFDTL
jgi:hypothetical protein